MIFALNGFDGLLLMVSRRRDKSKEALMFFVK